MNRYFQCSLFLLILLSAFFVFAAEEKKEEPSTKTLTVKQESSLIIYSDPANVRLVPWEKKEVAVSAEGINKKDLPLIQLTSKGKDIKVDYRGDKTVVGTLQIQYPNPFDVDVYSTGNIDLQAPVAGKLKFRSGIGTITTGDVNGSVTIDSTEAEVVMGNVQGDAVISTNGDVDVQDVSGDLELKNNHGDSYVRNIGGAVNAKSTDGDISVGEVGGNATLLSTIGDVELRKVSGLATLNTSDGDIDLFEATGLVIAATESGDITLRKISGSVDVKTGDGDVVAELFAGNGGTSKLFSEEGELAVYFPPEAKATVHVKIRSAIDDATDQIISDFKGSKTENDGEDLMRNYVINGGGDNVTIETVDGDILIKKLVPKPNPAATQTNP